MKIVVLGSNGMLGRYIYTYFKHKKYNILPLTRNDIDATDIKKDELRYKLKELNIKKDDIIINCIGMIKQRDNIPNLDFLLINTIFPLMLSDVCETENIKLIHPSTDCVYDGLDGNYTEDSIHNAIDIYGKSKSLGEPNNATVIRTSIIGDELDNKKSLVEWVKSNKGKTINGYTNHIWNGITCLEFSKVCEKIINNNHFWNGVKHIYSPTNLTKRQLVSIISNIYKLDIDIIPLDTPQICDRTLSSINNIDFNIPELEQQIKEMYDFYEILKNNI